MWIRGRAIVNLKSMTILYISNTMVDFKKTEQLYIKQGLVYQKKPHEIEFDRWYKSVTNPHKER